MEHEKKKGYHEAIAALANALELSSKLFHKGDKEAEASIRREAESLKASGEAYGDPEIAGMGTELMEAERKELPLVIESVIQSLRERVQTVSEEEKADILIVDDDRTITHILRHKLSSENRRLHFAATAADAKAILDKTEVSLILLDLFLPDADGRSVLVQLREIPNTATIPIIVLSGHSEGATKTECFALGATDFFEKPFDPDTLAAAVASGLHRAQELSRDVRQDSLTQIPNR
ncbi:MAG: PleD family two-component system response regulator, partial [Fidelibacterota bacterium]